MAALDLLGRRWTLRVLWELAHDPEAPTFRELQERCGAMSSSVLASRLSELREAQIVASADRGYVLTDLGHALLDALSPLTSWSAQWASAIADESPAP